MTSYLQICRDVGRDSGLVSTVNQLASVAAATQGVQEKIASFVNQAHTSIQRMRRGRWRFLRGEFGGALLAGQGHYTPAQLGILTRFGSFPGDIAIDGYFPHYLEGHLTMAFTLGDVEPDIGDTVTGLTSGATATVIAVSLTGGAWDGTGVGTLALINVVGTFQGAEALRHAGDTICKVGARTETVLTQSLQEIDAFQWEQYYGRGEQVANRPTHYARRNGGLSVGQIPDQTYYIKGHYWKSPQILVEDADEPEMPEQFHDIIKWRALILLHGVDGAMVDRSVAQQEYMLLMHQLVDEQGADDILMGGSLA